MLKVKYSKGISDEEILSRFRRGLSRYEIAIELGISVTTVFNILKSYGLVTFQTSMVDDDELLKLRENGLSNQQIADTVGLNLKTVYNHIGPVVKDRFKLSGKHDEIVYLYKHGYTALQLSEKYGVTRPTIYYHLRKDGSD